MKPMLRTTFAFNLVPPALKIKALGEILRYSRQNLRINIKVRRGARSNGLRICDYLMGFDLFPLLEPFAAAAGRFPHRATLS